MMDSGGNISFWIQAAEAATVAKALELADPEVTETPPKVVRQPLESTQFQHLANQIGAYDYDEALKTSKGLPPSALNRSKGEGYDGKR